MHWAGSAPRRVDAAAEQVEAAAGKVGQSLGAAVALEIRETLTAFVADEEAERTIRTGALVKSLSYSGFGSVDIADAVAIDPDESVARDVDRTSREGPGTRAGTNAGATQPGQDQGSCRPGHEPSEPGFQPTRSPWT